MVEDELSQQRLTHSFGLLLHQGSTIVRGHVPVPWGWLNQPPFCLLLTLEESRQVALFAMALDFVGI
jgi:hypothetical protein